MSSLDGAMVVGTAVTWVDGSVLVAGEENGSGGMYAPEEATFLPVAPLLAAHLT